LNLKALLFKTSNTIIFYTNLSVKILWSIWKSRTTKLWDTTNTSPTTIVTRAKDTLNKRSVYKEHEHRYETKISSTLELSHHCMISVMLMPLCSTIILLWDKICVFETLWVNFCWANQIVLLPLPPFWKLKL